MLYRSTSLSRISSIKFGEGLGIPDWNISGGDIVSAKMLEDPFVDAPRCQAGHTNIMANQSVAKVVHARVLGDPFSPRVDRLYDPVTPDTAQGVYPPEACVFVAKSVIARTSKSVY